MSIKYTKCRVTNEKIPIIFSYGIQPIANDFNNAKNFSKDNKFEMKTAFNKNYLFQLVDALKLKNYLIKIIHFFHLFQRIWKFILKRLPIKLVKTFKKMEVLWK